MARVAIEPVPQTQLIVQLAGAMELDLFFNGRQRRHQAAPGSVYLTAAHQDAYELSWKSQTAEPIRTIHLYLDNALLAQTLAAEAGVDPGQFELREGSCIPDLLLQQLGFTLAQELEGPASQSKLYADSVARLLAVHLVRHHGTRHYRIPEYRGKLLPARLRLIQEYVQAHLDQPIRIEDLAAIACLSAYHFFRVFKHTTGLSPNQYVIKHRMDKAQQLLRHTQLSITQVAYEVGYQSLGHFTQLFQRFTGRSPVSFQRG